MTINQWVVGERFCAFIEHEEVTTVSELMRLARSFPQKLLNMTLSLGQGLSNAERRLLRRLLKMKKVGGIVNDHISPADKCLTHKHKSENIMISDPVSMHVKGEQVYHSFLIVDDNCAEMEDHVTGQHIQGMVLVEAARQAMLAVSEKYILNDQQRGVSYCVLNNMEINFKQFVFPIDTVLQLTVLDSKTLRHHRQSVRTVSKFFQGDRLLAEISIDSLFDPQTAARLRESKMAKKSLRQNLKAA